jgi:hypothetical protein
VELGELLPEDEHVVYIVEDPVEVRRKKERLHFFGHLVVVGLVYLVNLFSINRR